MTPLEPQTIDDLKDAVEFYYGTVQDDLSEAEAVAASKEAGRKFMQTALYAKYKNTPEALIPFEEYKEFVPLHEWIGEGGA